MDWIFLVLLALFAIHGLIKGMILEIATLLGLVAGYFVALREMSVLSGLLQHWIPLKPAVCGIIAFSLIFIAITAAFRILAGLLRRFVKWTMMGWLDRGLGTLLGILKGAFFLSLLIMLVSMIPPSEKMKKAQEDSILFKPLQTIAPAVFNAIRFTFPKTKEYEEEIREGTAHSPKPPGTSTVDRHLSYRGRGDGEHTH